MKKLLSILVTLTVVICLTGCRTVYYQTSGQNSSLYANTTAHSDSELDLDISNTPITYTIDISTREGAQMLKNITLEDAKDLVTKEAVMRYKCALIFNPQYKQLMKGKQVLKIQIYGFPAKYKNQPRR